MGDNRPSKNIHDYSVLDDVLLRGGVAIVPTETVFGLAARPDNKASIDKIYTLKGRDFNKPLALCVAREEHYKDLVIWSALARELAAAFWPGPLTLVMHAKTPLALDPRLYSQDENGMATIALRCAKSSWSPMCSAMPVALTSANKSGQADALTFGAAYQAFGNEVDGAYQEISQTNALSGQPSTILAVNGRKVKLLRKGSITAADFAPFDIDWQF